MRCPWCGFEDTKVIDSRSVEGKKKRRRHCTQCGKRFTTYEIVERPLLMVAKRDGSFEPFNRNKLIGGIVNSIKKRPVKMEQVNALVDEIEAELANEMVSTVSPDRIGSMVMERLMKIDTVAYVRFASVYMAFSDVADFIRVISEMQEKSADSPANGPSA
ncbi:MAG: transcriptional repressor NrdR [Oscillospiraceae bacterium]|nr:transcriptional repressor NrdR [Oscillospiraceae bacterium]